MNCGNCGWNHLVETLGYCPRCGKSHNEGVRDHIPAWVVRKFPKSDNFWAELQNKTNLTESGLFSLMTLANDAELFGLSSSQKNRERWLFYCFDEYQNTEFDTLFESELLALQAKAKTVLSTPDQLRSFMLAIWSGAFLRFHPSQPNSAKLYAWLNSDLNQRPTSFWKEQLMHLRDLGFGGYINQFESQVLSEIGE
jgi:hypothetical protein